MIICEVFFKGHFTFLQVSYFLLKGVLVLIVTSTVTGIQYNTDDTIDIFNVKQFGKYRKYGALIIDDGHDKDGNYFMRFNKIDVKPLFDKWCKYELE